MVDQVVLLIDCSFVRFMQSWGETPTQRVCVTDHSGFDVSVSFSLFLFDTVSTDLQS